jgi:hypothetical protein
MTWADAGPVVTVIVRCDLVVCGPDVAPMWPQHSRAGKARPGSQFTSNATPMAQLSASPDRPPLSVGDREDRCYGNAEGTAGVAVTVTRSTGG